jgi:beta-mannosidase
MPPRLQCLRGCERRVLNTGWEVASCPPGAVESPRALNGSGLRWIAAASPTTAARVLADAGLWSLDAPPRRFDAEDWWFRTRFAIAPSEAADPWILGLDGLATIADVWLNDERLLTSESMFIAHEVSANSALRGENELVIRFRALDDLLAARRPRPRWRAPMIENQQLRWFRTTLLGRTPGWSPPAAPVGPWRPIWIERRGPMRIADLMLSSVVQGASGRVDFRCTIASPDTAGEPIVLCAARDGRSVSAPLRRIPGTDSFEAKLDIPDVDLWWPHTHGEPALYNLHLTHRGAALARLGRIGFRTIALDTSGGGFGLSVNGVRIFCRGACWTPLDPVSFEATPEELRRTFAQVRAAGFNMLRVGGTMVYESDDFLDACDEHGILLWQDFMFANMDYPAAEPSFASTVELEVRHQLARLSARPCLTVLCGNSEGEQQAAMWGAPRGSWSGPLFSTKLAELAQELRPDVPYWPSSAHGGAFPHQADRGTSSYYGVGAYLRSLRDARLAQVRFASECLAFANVPQDATLARMPGGPAVRMHHPLWKTRVPRDLGAGWDFDDVRDHYLSTLFRVDPLQLRYADPERYLALSRVVSGEVMAATFAEWRRKRSTCDGALIWFLRDLWAGAGWGIIGSDGEPKAPYYYLRRVLQPVRVSLRDEGGNGLYVDLINDRGEPLHASLRIAMYRAGATPVASFEQKVSVEAHEAAEMHALASAECFLDTTYAYRFGPLAHDLVVASIRASDGTVLSEDCYLPLGFAPLASAVPPALDLGIEAYAHSTPGGDAELIVSASRFAYAVTVHAEDFQADDQYFCIVPGERRRIGLRRVRVGTGLRGTVRALNTAIATRIELRS